MRKLVIALHTVFIMSALLGCTTEIDEGNLIGEYIANYPSNCGPDIDRISIKSDGTYTHYCKWSDGYESVYSGKWDYAVDGNTPWLSINGYRKQYGQVNPPPNDKVIGYNIIPEITMFDKIKLGIDVDLGYYYVKQTR